MNWPWLDFLLTLFVTQQAANREYFNTTDGTQIAKVVEGDVTFHAIRQPESIFIINVIELKNQLIVVDFGFIESSSTKALNYIKSLNKPDITCLLTHYHPDHINGYTVFKDSCTRTYSSEGVINQTNEVYNSRESNFGVVANEFLKNAQALPLGSQYIDGVQFIFQNVKGIEVTNFLFIVMPKQQAVFASDTININKHTFLNENHNLDLWLSYLDKVRSYGFRNVFLGHGFPVDWSNDNNYKQNVEYIKFIRDIANTYHTETEYKKLILDKFPSFVGGFLVGNWDTSVLDLTCC